MDLYNKLVTTLGNPLLIATVVGLVWYFGFKQKKIMNAIWTLVGGGITYYIMHNTLAVLQSFGSLAQAIINFFVGLIS